MLGVMIIPTGIGAEIGGHAGDANPVAKLLASVCDTLIVHPNVVNAADINEIQDNCLYVEGSILDRFLDGQHNLVPVKTYNKILVVANKPLTSKTINAVSAARATLGIDAEILELKYPLTMKGFYKEGQATGIVYGTKGLVEQVSDYDFRALAIHTDIDVHSKDQLHYAKHGGVNPWGGVEAICSRKIARYINKPVAHAPCETQKTCLSDLDLIVDPRSASEFVSISYLYSVLKGLHKSPQLTQTNEGISVNDVDFLISPDGCWGRPHIACYHKNIPIIIVEENKTILRDEIPDNVIRVKNYLEAAGLISSLKAGIDPKSTRRPLESTNIII